MALTVEIPGREPLRVDQLLLDVNGTLSDHGRLIDGVAEALAALRGELAVTLLSADTFGALAAIEAQLGVAAQRIASGEDKVRALRALGAQRCAAIGNGANDARMLREAALGIAVIGPEGARGCGVAGGRRGLLLDCRGARAASRPARAHRDTAALTAIVWRVRWSPDARGGRWRASEPPFRAKG